VEGNGSPPAGTIIVGLGNPLRADDGVGHAVAGLLRERLKDRPDIEVVVAFTGGLRLMERLIGSKRAYIIDAAHLGAPAGSWRWLDLGHLPTLHTASVHDADLPTALAAGRSAGASLPPDEQIFVLAIDVADVDSFSEELSPAVRAAVPSAAAAVLDHLGAQPGGPPTG
jgi:hydrogenase maturation protease